MCSVTQPWAMAAPWRRGDIPPGREQFLEERTPVRLSREPSGFSRTTDLDKPHSAPAWKPSPVMQYNSILHEEWV